MLDTIQKRANNLLLELQALKECDASNTIGALNLLNEVLRTAEAIALAVSQAKITDAQIMEAIQDSDTIEQFSKIA